MYDDLYVPEIVRITAPGDFVAAIPALLGFHPVNSLVAVLLDTRCHVVCTMRVDVPDDLTCQLKPLLGVAQRADAQACLLVIYTEHKDAELPRATQMHRLVRGLDNAGLTVQDAMLVD